MKSIFLIGMPSCGKTTVGKKIAEKLSFDFFDLDQYIEDTTKKSIPQIFDEFGEDHFRKLETEALTILSKKENAIISTGGGIVERCENIDILQKLGIVIFINRPLSNILSDVDVSNRPLLKDGKARLISLFERRIDLYKNACHIEIENNSSIDDLVLKITDEVKKNG